MPTILEKIIATKQQEISLARANVPEKILHDRIGKAQPPRDFFEALSQGGRMRLIAEIKKASPSQGLIRPDFDLLAIATSYARAGADCLSVLTDETYFQGHLDYLAAVHDSVTIPVLRKDFIIDPYQVLEARAAGADAVLLIAECLDNCRLRQLYGMIIDLGMTPLIELYDPANLDRVLETGTNLVGINNRNLHSFAVSLDHTLKLRERIPQDVLLVSESGIHSHSDVQLLFAAGVRAILVGEYFMRQGDVGRAVRQLLGLSG